MRNEESEMKNYRYIFWDLDGTLMDTYEGETKEAIQDGYFAESTLRSAPYFAERIDGITEDAPPAE